MSRRGYGKGERLGGSEFKLFYYVYLLRQQNSDFYKIGVSGDVVSRIKQLQVGNPHKIEVFKCFEFEYDEAYEVEIQAHKNFFKFHINGEWFNFNSENLKMALENLSAWETFYKEKNAAKNKLDKRLTLLQHRQKNNPNSLKGFHPLSGEKISGAKHV